MTKKPVWPCCTLVMFAGLASETRSQPTVSVNNVNSDMHEITASPGGLFSVELNVATNGELLDLLVGIWASAGEVFEIVGGFYHSPWDTDSSPIPLGWIGLLEQSIDFSGSPGYGNVVAPGDWKFVTLDLAVESGAPPGEYAINVYPVWSTACPICPAFIVGTPGPDFVVRVVPEAVPAVSTWGLIALALLTMVLATIMLARQRRVGDHRERRVGALTDPRGPARHRPSHLDVYDVAGF